MARTLTSYKEFLLKYGGFLSISDILDPYYQWVGECMEEVITDTLKNLKESFEHSKTSNDDFYITKCEDEFDYLHKYIRLYIITSICSSLYHELDKNKGEKNVRRYVLDAIMCLVNKHYMDKGCLYPNEKDLDIHEMYYIVEKYLESYGEIGVAKDSIFGTSDRFKYYYEKSNEARYTNISMSDPSYNSSALWKFGIVEDVISKDEIHLRLNYSKDPIHEDELEVVFGRYSDKDYSVGVYINETCLFFLETFDGEVLKSITNNEEE